MDEKVLSTKKRIYGLRRTERKKKKIVSSSKRSGTLAARNAEPKKIWRPTKYITE